MSGISIGIIAYSGWKFWKKRQEEVNVQRNLTVIDRILALRNSGLNSDNENDSTNHLNNNSQIHVGAANLNNSSNDNQNNTDHRCRVCLENPLEVIFLNCGHISCCGNCAAAIMTTNARCPICRQTITTVSPAYLS